MKVYIDNSAKFNYDFHGILKISSDIDLERPYFAVTTCDPDLTVKIKEFEIRDSGQTLRLGKNYFGEYDKDYVIFKATVLRRSLKLYIENIQGKTNLFCNKAYFKYVRLPLVFSTPIEQLIWRVAHVKLLMKGFTFIHSACLALGENAFLLLGFSDAGKTSTTLLSLLRDKDLKYLSDDMTILDSNGEAYSHFTRIKSRTLKSCGIPVAFKSQVAMTIEKLIPPPFIYFVNPTSTIFKAGTSNITDIFDVSRIGVRAKVRLIVFLERGPCGIFELDRDTAVERMLIQNKEGLSPHYSVTPLLLYYSYFNKSFKLDKLVEREEKIIRKTVDSSEKVLVVRSRNFVDCILKIIKMTQC